MVSTMSFTRRKGVRFVDGKRVSLILTDISCFAIGPCLIEAR